MFTGIVTHRGRVTRVDELGSDGARLHVAAGELAADLPHGGSLAVDGVCLTAVTDPDESGSFTADVMGETLRVSTLGRLRPGALVNLERCTAAGQRLDGHVVQGHVDGVGEVLARREHHAWHTVRIGLDASLAKYVAVKGSIAVDGVSLTVTAVSEPEATPAWFEIGLIPQTLRTTSLGQREPGEHVNLEVDVLAKYAERLAAHAPAPATGSSPVRLDPVAAAVEAMAAGRAVVVVDDADRENEGDLVFAAQHATRELMGFTIRHSSGVVCVPMTAQHAEALQLPPMTEHNEDAKGTAYTVTCDAREGISTGISAADRALTTRVLAATGTRPDALTRPGHILPLRAVEGGVRQRRGHTEASIELAELAGCAPVAAIAEIVDDHGEPLRSPALREFADRHGLPMISIDDLVTHLDHRDALAAEHRDASGAARAEASRDSAEGAHREPARHENPAVSA